jgi:hypothetical protein
MAATEVDALEVPAAPLAAAVTNPALPIGVGDLLVQPQSMTPFTAPGTTWIVARGAGGDEVRRIGTFGVVGLDLGAYATYPAGTLIQEVTLAGASRLVQGAPAPTASVFTVDDASGLEAGMSVAVAGTDARILSVSGNEITLLAALGAAPPANDPVTPFTTLSGDAAVGSLVLSLANRQGLAAGATLQIGTDPDEEYVTVARIVGERGPTPDAGTVVLAAALAQDHASGARVDHLAPPAIDPAGQAARLVLATPSGGSELYLNDETGYAVGDRVRVTTPSGASFLHRLVADTVTVSPGTVELDRVLAYSHEAGGPLLERAPLIEVFALDSGGAGNRIRVAVADNEPPLVQSRLTSVIAAQTIALSNFTNLEAGTLLELLDSETGNAVGTPLKVRRVDRAAGEVALDPPGLSATQIGAQATAQAAGQTLGVRSREFLLSVFVLQRPDPAIPSRNDTVIDSERFLLSMDSRHSRYIQRVIGTTWVIGSDNDEDGNPLRLWDRRSEGSSAYIRVRGMAAGDMTVTESVRLGPEALVDILDSGRTQPARLPLAGGTDAADTMSAAMYVGSDSDEPQLRAGIPALRNVEEIAIVGAPGQTATDVQQALIDHCEAERYRFAVLDSEGPPRDTIADVLALRQRYDTRYAALYYPWVTIPEPHPANISDIRQIAIPPSGHVVGIYARVDNTRGVHKAPANEVLRGITGVTQKIHQREHDVLNPYPVNIDVLRDFRDSNRGLRVWGARCITSDSDWKYVNVRRLLIFIEASIDRGLKWAVFEPNAEPLWARVTRAIANFLTLVWRNGALEGTSVEQAFFVKCDRTTMTQTDIDEGRLICVIGVAPVKPAEFVIIRIGLWTADAEQ